MEVTILTDMSSHSMPQYEFIGNFDYVPITDYFIEKITDNASLFYVIQLNKANGFRNHINFPRIAQLYKNALELINSALVKKFTEDNLNYSQYHPTECKSSLDLNIFS